jgi:8-oxo-dGTP diphosphatase
MIDVACAIIVNPRGQVLVTQRSTTMKLPLKMEFPGGKVEKGETLSACLIREIKEELNLDIRVIFEMPANEHVYPDFKIRLIPFVCEITGGVIVLKEHADYCWLDANELPDLDWAAADIPVMKNYIDSITPART